MHATTEESQEPSLETKIKKPKTFWGWQLIWLGVLFAFAGIGGIAFMLLLATPPVPNCQKLTSIASDGEQLYCANKDALSGNIKAIDSAFALIQKWPKDHPLYAQAQKYKVDWSKSILELGRKKLSEGDLQTAIKIVDKIPPDVRKLTEIDAEVNGWQQNWAEGEKLYNKSIESLKGEAFKQASEYAEAISKLDNVYWRQKRFEELVQQIADEKRGSQRLKEAKDIAYDDTPEKLAEAIALASQIDAKLYAGQKAEIQISKWSQNLLDRAQKKLTEKDLQSTISLANMIPKNSQQFNQAQDLIKLGYAQAASWNQSIETSPLVQIFNVLEGKAAATTIPTDSPFYQKAQIEKQSLEQQFHNLLQIQLATATASFGQPLALKIAIEQAKMLDNNQPRFKQAQSLVNSWNEQIARIEDKYYLALAEQVAKPGSLDAYKMAIEQARRVAIGRPLRLEAQTKIAYWNKQIQTAEDQPIINAARKLGKEGKLNDAINMAAKIKKDRALYETAQTDISQWRSQIEIAEDRPILQEASNLASQGLLTAAINTAYKISYGRALYEEAQNSIIRWETERDRALATQNSPAPLPPTDDNQQPTERRNPVQGSETYTEPQAPSYTEPAPSYTEPQAPSYTEPQAPSYTEPAPESYSPPPPSSESYSDPAPVEEPVPAEPAPENVPQEPLPPATTENPPPVEPEPQLEPPPAAEPEVQPPAPAPEAPSEQSPPTDNNLLQE